MSLTTTPDGNDNFYQAPGTNSPPISEGGQIEKLAAIREYSRDND